VKKQKIEGIDSGIFGFFLWLPEASGIFGSVWGYLIEVLEASGKSKLAARGLWQSQASLEASGNFKPFKFGALL